ncbi:GtrA family protein [Sphingomonas sp. AP4-R1]|uniref:GtrA family protein n=1 Tax=Sphingomonas sp. AP4-R1 TaxID=2735134 RepID=UPI001493DE13|nr:GtrA family protein [Sphingomonas sp. AP4-R1]QJU56906.1 GtrA family protein [Sphingomonas sp. AP4-R1]
MQNLMTADTTKRGQLLGQLIRYGVNGVVVTGIYTAIYVGLDSFTHAPIQLCNLAAFLVSVVVGYNLHSRITFAGQGDRGHRAWIRFFLAALPSFALNAFWTWLFATALHWPHWTVQLPVWFVTPVMIFAINRWWVFK